VVALDANGNILRAHRRASDLSHANLKKMAKGGIVSKAIHAMLGESGPEAVIFLSGNAAARAGIGSSHFAPVYNLSVNVSGGGDADFANRVADVVRERFEEIQSEAFHHYQRVHLS
jgi:hypothetical protein